MILDIDFVIPYRAALWKRCLQGPRDKLGPGTTAIQTVADKGNLKLAWGRL